MNKRKPLFLTACAILTLFSSSAIAADRPFFPEDCPRLWAATGAPPRFVDPGRTLTYDEFMDFKIKHLDQLDKTHFRAYDPIVSRFYREHYKGKSILIFADDDFNQSSGVATVMQNMKDRLERMSGLKVVFVTPSYFKKHVKFNFQGQKFQQAVPTEKEVLEFIKQYDPAAVHVMAELLVGNKARSTLIKHNVPFSTAYHTDWSTFISARLKSPKVSFMKPVIEELVNKYLRKFHGAAKDVMVPNRSILEKLVEKKFRKGNLQLWSHGVDLERFRPELRDETLYERLAAEQGRQVKRPYVVMVSRFSVEKNVDDFMDAPLPSGGTKFFIGPGSPSELEYYKKKYPDVVFLGNRDNKTELPSLYASADTFLFTGLHETYGLVNGEALASGTPVVAYNVQGPKDILTSPKAGVLVNHDPKNRDANLKGLGDAVTQALKLDRKGVREFAEELDWDNSVAEFLNFLYPLEPKHLAKVPGMELKGKN